MSKELREAYNTIASDYLSKKQPPWSDFLRFLEIINFGKQHTVIDVGAGNGRNLLGIVADLHIALDLSFDLLLGYVGPVDGQKVAGSLPHLPFRRYSTSSIISIAVIHHLSEIEVVPSLIEIKRIGTDEVTLILSVWRRWRSGYKEKLFNALKHGKSLDNLVNHDRPWYNSDREVQTTRFYHYYTFRELYHQVSDAGFCIDSSKYLGGKQDDANIFVKLTIKR